jgi:hypothetical protein
MLQANWYLSNARSREGWLTYGINAWERVSTNTDTTVWICETYTVSPVIHAHDGKTEQRCKVAVCIDLRVIPLFQIRTGEYTINLLLCLKNLL